MISIKSNLLLALNIRLNYKHLYIIVKVKRTK